MPDVPPTSLTWVSVARKSGQKSPTADVKDWSVATEDVEVIAAKGFTYKSMSHFQF